MEPGSVGVRTGGEERRGEERGSFFWVILLGHSFRSFLSVILLGHSFRSFFLVILMGRSYRSFFWSFLSEEEESFKALKFSVWDKEGRRKL